MEVQGRHQMSPEQGKKQHHALLPLGLCMCQLLLREHGSPFLVASSYLPSELSLVALLLRGPSRFVFAQRLTLCSITAQM